MEDKKYFYLGFDNNIRSFSKMINGPPRSDVFYSGIQLCVETPVGRGRHFDQKRSHKILSPTLLQHG